ncbi:MAG: xanthine dehydrogenase accessory protein XdhC, partial [Gammaproteobacteria bacterium]|nr:xanthine dehydrogenase accessory protein XdhC [Gammaproteobacteria bacterium]
IGGSAGKFIIAADLETGPGELPHEVRERALTMLACDGGTERLGEYVIETVVNSDFNIAVFGAGHVGAAVVPLLASLDCNVRWIDSRRNIFRALPQNVRAIEAAEPALEVAAMPPGSYYLVMTHSHAIDHDIVSRILLRSDAAYCGLIGSVSKRRRFEKRFRAQGIGDAKVAGLTCPIGVDGISGKKPAEIAVAVAAELLQSRDRAAQRLRGELPDNVRPLKR